MFNLFQINCVLISFLLLCFPTTGQEIADSTGKATTSSTEKSTSHSGDEQAVREAFDSIQQLVKQGKWKKAAKEMTKQAQDELVIEQVISAIGLTKVEMPIPLPQFEDALDEIENVINKYEIDKLKIDTSAMFKFDVKMGEEDESSDENNERPDEAAKDQMSQQGNKILKHVDKSGKRWEVVSDLWNAKKSSPFAMSPLTGSIEKIATGKSGEYQLQIKVAPPKSNDDSGVMIQMASPPVVLRMVKQDGKWKLDGRDQEQTEKLMREFMKNQPMMRNQPRQDF